MRGRRGLTSAAVLALALTLAASGMPGSAPNASAAAAAVSLPKQIRYAIPAGHVTRFELRGSNGYDIVVSANDRRFLTVKALKGGSRTEYVVRGEPTAGLGGKGHFRGLGTVSFGFRPQGRARQLPAWPGCEGGPSVRKGVARGRVEFSAERDFTGFSVRRVRAEVLSWPRLRCRLGAGARGDGGESDVAADFRAFAPSRRAFVGISATRFTAGSRPRARRIRFEATRPRASGAC